MANRLIIVESPTKARTLGRFLGAGYTVKASMGHVRDLPKRGLGVDVDNAFAPEYEVTKEAQVRELRQAAKKADGVLLASDPDREGEAIAWHLAEALHLRDPERIVFHEVTRPAVEAALNAPRKIDRDLVAAQEARRVIDRLVGYQLSPLLWKKVSGGGQKRLSAGRVQSVAVRLVVDREREIEAFVTEESWTVDALLRTADGTELTARLYARRGEAADEDGDEPREGAAAPGSRARDGSRLVLGDEAAAIELMRVLGVDEEGMPTGAAVPFVVGAIVSGQRTGKPLAPYTTSTLQQEASSRLRMSPGQTMRVAQQLYEGVELGGEGPTGLITYMRTDSTRISPTAREAAVHHIESAYGKAYVGSGVAGRKRKAPVQAQEAHEAIRPTDPARTPESVTRHLSPEQLRVYELIWRRFLAGQMAPPRFDTLRVDIEADAYVFRATGSVLRFEGYLKVWRRDDDREDRLLPPLTQGERLALARLRREQHFTQPPARYTEASLIKELEERGIGRPSTYATIVDTIQERAYVVQDERKLQPTGLGVTVDGVLREHFPDIVDVDFTAALEKRLDGIEAGRRDYAATVRDWYTGFSRELTRAEEGMERVRVPARPTGQSCPECAEGELVVRESRYGEFTGCSRYPECKYKESPSAQAEATGEDCPKCARPLVSRRSKRGPFVGCSGYPECDYIKKTEAAQSGGPAEDLGACPDCGRPLGRRMSRRGPFVGCTGYPECRHIQSRSGGRAAGDGAAGTARPAPQPAGRECPQCGKPLVVRVGRRGPFIGCSGYPRCRHTEGEVTALTAPAADLGALGAPAEGDGAAGGQGDQHAGAGSPAAAVAASLGPCPECGRPLLERRGRYGPFVSCSGYPGCTYRPPRRSREAAAPAVTVEA